MGGCAVDRGSCSFGVQAATHESAPGMNRRRHVRVDCDWPVSAVGIELTGTETAFEAAVRNISTSGLYLETNVGANLAVDKPLRITLPDPIGRSEERRVGKECR